MAAPNKNIPLLSRHINRDFTDKVYSLVCQEAKRLRYVEGVTLTEASNIAAFFALIPIAAIASNGNKKLEDRIGKMCEAFINSLKEMD